MSIQMPPPQKENQENTSSSETDKSAERDIPETIGQIFDSLPNSFLTWCFEKKMVRQDLRPLLSVPHQEWPLLYDFLVYISTAQFSKSLGTTALELGVENYLINPKKFLAFIDRNLKPSSNLLTNNIKNKKDKDWFLTQLKKERYPITTQQDQFLEKKFKSLNWPKSFSTRWLREGDRSGLEVKFLITQGKDLEKIIDALVKVKFELCSNWVENEGSNYEKNVK